MASTARTSPRHTERTGCGVWREGITPVSSTRLPLPQAAGSHLTTATTSAPMARAHILSGLVGAMQHERLRLRPAHPSTCPALLGVALGSGAGAGASSAARAASERRAHLSARAGAACCLAALLVDRTSRPRTGRTPPRMASAPAPSAAPQLVAASAPPRAAPLPARAAAVAVWVVAAAAAVRSAAAAAAAVEARARAGTR